MVLSPASLQELTDGSMLERGRSFDGGVEVVKAMHGPFPFLDAQEEQWSDSDDPFMFEGFLDKDGWFFGLCTYLMD